MFLSHSRWFLSADSSSTSHVWPRSWFESSWAMWTRILGPIRLLLTWWRSCCSIITRSAERVLVWNWMVTTGMKLWERKEMTSLLNNWAVFCVRRSFSHFFNSAIDIWRPRCRKLLHVSRCVNTTDRPRMQQPALLRTNTAMELSGEDQWN